MPVQIRDLDDASLDQAVRLWEDAEADGMTSVFSLAEVLAAVAAEHPAVVAVDERDAVVGAAATRVEGGRAWLLRWVVAPADRRRGIGSSLLRTLERRLLADGVKDVAMLAPPGTVTEAATASGYVERGPMAYLEKRRLARSSAADGLAELGAQWPAAELWGSIGGMEREKELVERRVVLPLAEPEEARRHGVVPASAIILFGPPGTGKTTFAKAIAGRLAWPFVEVFPSQLGGGDAHSRAAALRELFERLSYLDRVVAFIDEVEEIASHRQARPETHVLANELLKVIPAFREPGSRLLVVATNSVRELDHAFTRPGRFDYLLPVGPPDRRARIGIWERYVAAITDGEIDLEELAERSQYFSAADIEFAARKAAQAAFERAVLGGDGGRAMTDDFLAALADVRPTITAAMAREFDEDIERYARS